MTTDPTPDPDGPDVPDFDGLTDRVYAMLNGLAIPDEDEAAEVLSATWETLGPDMQDWRVAYAVWWSLASTAGEMLAATIGVGADEQVETAIVVMTPDGQPIDNPEAVEPNMTWCVRWLTAAVRGDHDTAMALWVSVPDDFDEMYELIDLFMGVMVRFLRNTVLGFVAAGGNIQHVHDRD